MIVNLLQIFILVFTIIISVGFMKKRGSSVVMFYFAFGLVCMLLANLYWLACEIIDPEIMDPYNINEIGEMGSFLLFASLLNVVFKDKKVNVVPDIILTLIFTVVVTALWIAWSDEWIKNITGSFYFGYMMCVTVVAVKKTGVLKKVETMLLWTTVFAILCVQILIFYVEEPAAGILDTIAYVLIFSLLAYLLGRALLQVGLALKGGSIETSEKAVALSFFSFIWSQNAMYMSNEPLFSVAAVTGAVILVLALSAVISYEKAKAGKGALLRKEGTA